MNVHLIGIGGVGMAGLAVLLKNRGHAVSGCDVHLGPRTDWLAAQGIRVFEGHDPSHVENAEAVIVTPAVHADNLELVRAGEILNTEARRHGGGIRFRGEVLAELVSEAKDSIAVCGSHGKTTTATWIAKLLIALGESVEWAIGGETGDFPVAGKSGGRLKVEGGTKEDLSSVQPPTSNLQSVLVVEADESDGTLAKYRAKTLVVTNCEYDHPDHFKTREEYFACYETAKRNAGEVVEEEGLGGLGSLGGFAWFGNLALHNRKNARVAIEVALRRGHKIEDILAVMPSVVAALPDRRFQTIWPTSATLHSSLLTSHSVTVVTDYAHHPTEMACAVQMARAICKGKLRVLFQPHRYSRTKALLKDFPKAFDGADEVVLCPTYAAFENPVEGGDIADLYRECRENFNTEAQRHGACRFYLARSCDEAWEHARNSMADGDVTLLLGAGDIINLVPKIQNDLTLSPSHPLTRLWIGAGSNTWKSDLNLSVEYVKTEGPANAPGASLGIPWMAGIPGTIGGWVKMNAGAFGHSISEVLEAVKVDGEWIAAADCGFGYRTSKIAGEIQDVRLKGEVGGGCGGSAGERAEDYLARRKKFPAGTKGSVFKNPSGDYAGRLLEAAGCKGLRVGGARVWEEHANVIVSDETANNSDFLALARLMHNRVFFRFGVRLEPEVCGLAPL